MYVDSINHKPKNILMFPLLYTFLEINLIIKNKEYTQNVYYGTVSVSSGGGAVTSHALRPPPTSDLSVAREGGWFLSAVRSPNRREWAVKMTSSLRYKSRIPIKTGTCRMLWWEFLIKCKMYRWAIILIISACPSPLNSLGVALHPCTCASSSTHPWNGHQTKASRYDTFSIISLNGCY